MAANPKRRTELCDAGLVVVAESGVGGLTHRAVDRAAALPLGTCSNYFRTRDLLLGALGSRILERIGPDPERVERLAGLEPSLELLTVYIDDIFQRATSQPKLMLALFELRLEATRRPRLAEILTETLGQSFGADVDFNTGAGLPGGALEIALLHYAIDGFLFDQLTTPVMASVEPRAILETIVHRIVVPGEAQPTD